MREILPSEVAPAVAVAPLTPSGGTPSRRRDARLDALRGAALVTIFVNHVPGNVLEAATLRNFGFSDAAEGFVLMAGVSAGIAYGPAFRPGGDAVGGTLRAWGRAWALYLVHLLVTAAALAIAAGLALWGDAPALLQRNGVDAVFLHPLETLAAIPLLLHQLGYANILPLYALLLMAAPALLVAGWRAPHALLAGSVALWAASGQVRLNLPSWPVEGGWFFSPTSWQLLFVLGLLTGLAMRQGRRFVPVRGWLIVLAGGFVALALVWRLSPAVAATMNGALGWLDQAGAPWVLVAFHKTWETAPRLLHALALAYLVSAIPAVRHACESRWAAPLALLGRHSLPVFGLGSVLAFLLQGIKSETAAGPALDVVMLGAGVLLLLALAYAREWGRTRRPAR